MPKSDDTTSVGVESNDEAKGKTPLIADDKEKKSGLKKIMGILDFVLRLAAIIAALVAAATMGTSNKPSRSSLGSSESKLATMIFRHSGYLVISLPFSIVTMICPNLVVLRIFLFVFDIVVLSLGTVSAAAAAIIVYLAHNGNPNINWQSICQHFGDFCQKMSETVVTSFVAVVFFMLLVLLSGCMFLKTR
ncbi:hypothetical protein V6N13_103100 [Hibiscus sabdariffa]|uniref:CASP-like protein n=1 Tax=Hibiscus sabdariffa TaxID=183260 RepID=A0ABR2C5R5_9ROSI